MKNSSSSGLEQVVDEPVDCRPAADILSDVMLPLVSSAMPRLTGHAFVVEMSDFLRLAVFIDGEVFLPEPDTNRPSPSVTVAVTLISSTPLLKLTPPCSWPAIDAITPAAITTEANDRSREYPIHVTGSAFKPGWQDGQAKALPFRSSELGHILPFRASLSVQTEVGQHPGSDPGSDLGDETTHGPRFSPSRNRIALPLGQESRGPEARRIQGAQHAGRIRRCWLEAVSSIHCRCPR